MFVSTVFCFVLRLSVHVLFFRDKQHKTKHSTDKRKTKQNTVETNITQNKTCTNKRKTKQNTVETIITQNKTQYRQT
jgi:uncharacterized membrane protein